MRVTNSMIANSSQSHIASAKNNLLTAQNQYTTQKKILRPSDDPTVAIRSLQLRTTYSKINQYVEKNVQDAMDWMDTTETALDNIGNILTYMKGYLNQGANDYLGMEERTSVLSVLKEYAEAIFQEEANTDYAGRYVFTGYRTDTSLVFPEDEDGLEYEILENFSTDSINKISYVKAGARYADGLTVDDYAENPAEQITAYHLQLAYSNCSDTAIQDGSSSGEAVSIQITLADGSSETLNVSTLSSDDADAYDPDTLGVDAVYIYDTGEVIFSSDTYAKMIENGSTISVQYTKKEFDKNDIRPEMYFECTKYNTVSKAVTEYEDPSGQDISYEVNFNQLSQVNLQAKDVISTDIYRVIDYIEETILAMDQLEAQIEDVETLISNTTDEDELEAYNKLKDMLEEEQKLRTSAMTEAFGMGLTMVDEVQETINVATADLGARYKRLELTYDKLLDQQLNTEEKLSDTEGVDLTDAYINLTQADNLYQASLLATSKILGLSLLNYI
ncbi:MAG: flagellar hook-associated protein FlgL [Clostridiaceae bacterium]|nr:flagellar hook-associated protein FlgL [Clostridiaceae bacterium]